MNLAIRDARCARFVSSRCRHVRHLGAVVVGAIGGLAHRCGRMAELAAHALVLLPESDVHHGGDEVVRLLTLYLAWGYSAISPGRRALTFDGARARAVESQTTMQVHEAWPLRMIQVQICLVYLASGFLKVVGPAWWDGSALPLALGDHTFSRLGAPDWTWAQPFFAIGGIAIAWWELLFAALMVNKRTRVPALWFGVAMHAGIFVTMSIGIFSVIMIGGYAAFLTPAESRWIVERARGLLRRKREALPSA